MPKRCLNKLVKRTHVSLSRLDDLRTQPDAPTSPGIQVPQLDVRERSVLLYELSTAWHKLKPCHCSAEGRLQPVTAVGIGRVSRRYALGRVLHTGLHFELLGKELTSEALDGDPPLIQSIKDLLLALHVHKPPVHVQHSQNVGRHLRTVHNLNPRLSGQTFTCQVVV